MPSQDNSVFAPALTRRGVSYRHFGLYQPQLGALTMPAWTPFAVIAAIGALAIFRKIPWWLAGVGAVGAWFILKQAPPGSISGTVTLANGQTLTLTSDAGFTAGGSVLNMTVNGTPMAYSVLAAGQNPSTGAWSITAADNGATVPVATTPAPAGT